MSRENRHYCDVVWPFAGIRTPVSDTRRVKGHVVHVRMWFQYQPCLRDQ